MPKLAANLSMMFQELPFLDRFAAAADAGFEGVEFLFPYEYAASDIAVRLRDHGLTQALFNLPPGNWAAGERGIAALPGREQEFAANLDRALEYAIAIDCRRLHVMAGVYAAAGSLEQCQDIYVANLQRAADRAAPHGITVMLEPLNTRDAPGYLVSTTTQALALLERVRRPNARLQLDLYHCAIMEGDLATRVRALAGRYAHVQIAGVPERHEPDCGEVNYAYLLRVLDETGYAGWVGCEYRPAHGTREGLGWAREWGIGGPE